MKDDRLRQPTKPDYLYALGTVTSCFAICEWNAVYCAERIRPGSLRTFAGEGFTAGSIAKKFLDLARNMPKSPGREEVTAAAQSFSDLVPLRNSILHGKPCTGPSGEARLTAAQMHNEPCANRSGAIRYNAGKVLEIPDLEDAADAFSACSIELNRLLYGFLATFTPN